MYLYVHVKTHTCIHIVCVCVCVRVYVCMYVCMYICIYMYIYMDHIQLAHWRKRAELAEEAAETRLAHDENAAAHQVL